MHRSYRVPRKISSPVGPVFGFSSIWRRAFSTYCVGSVVGGRPRFLAWAPLPFYIVFCFHFLRRRDFFSLQSILFMVISHPPLACQPLFCLREDGRPIQPPFWLSLSHALKPLSALFPTHPFPLTSFVSQSRAARCLPIWFRGMSSDFSTLTHRFFPYLLRLFSLYRWPLFSSCILPRVLQRRLLALGLVAFWVPTLFEPPTQAPSRTLFSLEFSCKKALFPPWKAFPFSTLPLLPHIAFPLSFRCWLCHITRQTSFSWIPRVPAQALPGFFLFFRAWITLAPPIPFLHCPPFLLRHNARRLSGKAFGLFSI